MIAVGREARVFVATEPIDFRTGVHGLVAKVAQSFNSDPYSGDVYVFQGTGKFFRKRIGMLLVYIESDAAVDDLSPAEPAAANQCGHIKEITAYPPAER